MKIAAGFVLVAMVAFATAVPPSPTRPSGAFGPFGPQGPYRAGARPGEFYMGRWNAPGGVYGNQPFAPRRVRRQIGSSSAAAASSAATGMGMGYGMMGMRYPMGYPVYG